MSNLSEIEGIVRECVAALGADVSAVETVETAVHPLITISTPDSKILIGPRGEHLKALNLVVRRIVERKFGTDSVNFFVDVNGYHRKRIDEIERNAKMLAERVRLFKSSAEMSPMSPYERMVVHALFAEDAEISTESEGSGPTRHIVLRYKNPEL
jgi:spoIIIJ-associated protein